MVLSHCRTTAPEGGSRPLVHACLDRDSNPRPLLRPAPRRSVLTTELRRPSSKERGLQSLKANLSTFVVAYSIKNKVAIMQPSIPPTFPPGNSSRLIKTKQRAGHLYWNHGPANVCTQGIKNNLYFPTSKLVS